jgi:single stranded DNA-binding protein
VRGTANGGRVATLATSRTWKDQAGERQERTEWHRVVLWNTRFVNLADIAERCCKKGDKLYIDGSIEYRSWQAREGQTPLYDRDQRSGANSAVGERLWRGILVPEWRRTERLWRRG